MTIGNTIKKIRKENKLTQKELANKIGISEISIRKYEAGQRSPSLEILIKLANVLDIPLIELIGEDPNSDLSYEFIKYTVNNKEEFANNSNDMDLLHKKPSEVKIKNRLNDISESIDLFLSDKNLEEEFDYKFSELDIFEQNEINSFIFHMIDIKINEIKLRKQYNEKFKNIKEGE